MSKTEFKHDLFVVEYSGYYYIQTTPVYGSPSVLNAEDVGGDVASDYATLFAAAPDLLEALIEVVRISDRKHDAWDKAKAAINKATQNK